MGKVAPKLIAITNEALVNRELSLVRLERCCRLAEPATVLVLLRDPELSIRERLNVGDRLRRMTRESGQLLSVRDRLDLALFLDTDGLHLSEASILPERVRDATGSRFFLSRAFHDLSLLPSTAVDALLVSPVCAPRKNNPASGLLAFGTFARRNSHLKIYALGGMDESNATDCLRVGGAGVAAMGAVLSNDEPRELLTALGCLRR